MKLRVLGNIKYNGNMLEKHEVYDIDETSADQLLKDGSVEKVKEDYPNVNKVTTKTRGKNPGQLVDATENDTKGVKAVEPNVKENVKGNDTFKKK